jgi:disulfide bond formation protein DsbB
MQFTCTLCVAIRDTFLGIGPILLGRIFDYILQPSLPLL